VLRWFVATDLGDRRTLEEEVAEAQRASNRLLDALPVLLWRADANGRCDYFNETWLHFTGRPLAQEVGTGWTDGVHPDDLEHVIRVCLESFGARTPYELEFRLRRHDRTYRHMVAQGRPLFDAERRFTGFLGTVQDVTEQFFLSRIGRRALGGCSIGELYAEASCGTVDCLGAGSGVVIERLPSGALALRESVDGVGARGRRPALTAAELAALMDACPVGRPLAVQEPAAEVHPALASLLRARGAATCILSPIDGSASSYGMLALFAARPRRFTSPEAEFVQSVANVLGFALERGRQVETLEQRVAERTEALVERNREYETLAYSVAHDFRARCARSTDSPRRSSRTARSGCPRPRCATCAASRTPRRAATS
jgi:PAS domain S-box-containing protein